MTSRDHTTIKVLWPARSSYSDPSTYSLAFLISAVNGFLACFGNFTYALSRYTGARYTVYGIRIYIYIYILSECGRRGRLLGGVFLLWRDFYLKLFRDNSQHLHNAVSVYCGCEPVHTVFYTIYCGAQVYKSVENFEIGVENSENQVSGLFFRPSVPSYSGSSRNLWYSAMRFFLRSRYLALWARYRASSASS